jgi:hypothetical protein
MTWDWTELCKVIHSHSRSGSFITDITDISGNAQNAISLKSEIPADGARCKMSSLFAGSKLHVRANMCTRSTTDFPSLYCPKQVPKTSPKSEGDKFH